MSLTASDPAAGRRTRPAAGRRTDLFLGVLGLASIVALTEILSRTRIVDPQFLPPATEMGRALLADLGRVDFWTAFGQTVRGWAIGLAIAMALGIAFGGIVGSIGFLRRATASTIEFLRPIPSVALIPLVVLIYGSRPQSALVLVVYASFWQILVQVLYGVADVDPVVRDTAHSYRFRSLTVFRTVVWPTALPYVVTGFRLAAAVALVLEITAELVIGVPGLGQLIGVAQSSAAVPETYALVIVVGVIGVAVNVFARWIERRVLRWHVSVRRDLS